MWTRKEFGNSVGHKPQKWLFPADTSGRIYIWSCPSMGILTWKRHHPPWILLSFHYECPLILHPAYTDLEPGCFIQVFHSIFLFPVFSTSSRHPAEEQANRGPDKGERETQSASACSLQPHSWQEAACNSAASRIHTSCCAQARGTGLTSHPPEIPLLVMN